MRVVAVIQARMGSSRLPGKVLMDIAGRSMLARVVERVQRAPGIHEVVVATTVAPADDAVAAEAGRLGVTCFRGSEQDVLDRYYQCAQAHAAQVIVRVTADCPLLDPEVTGHVVAAFLEHRPDYASNTLERTYPRGLDTEVFSMDALTRAWREALQPHQREHVTPYFYENPDLFTLLSVTDCDGEYGHHRWTVDTADDLRFVRAVYEALGGDLFGRHEILPLLAKRPELAAINAHVRQKALVQP